MLQEFINAFGLIFLAEMGDKTQILALAFATRYRVRQVLIGIFFGVLLNHGLAVLLGNLLASVVPMDLIQLFAGGAFLAFALWSLRVEESDEESSVTSQRGPILTVALAFFIGELGDKTQLSAITLSSVADYPLLILAGTVTGMLVVGSLGIVVGRQLGSRIPETALKLVAAAVFAFFGMQKLLTNAPAAWLASIWMILGIILYGAMATFLVLRLRSVGETGLQKQAERLRAHYQSMAESLNEICLHCQSCQGGGCHVGYAKLLMSDALTGQPGLQRFVEHEAGRQKPYPQSSITQALDTMEEILQEFPHDPALLGLKKQLLQMQEPDHLPNSQNVL